MSHQYLISIGQTGEYFYFGPFTLSDEKEVILRREIEEYRKQAISIVRGQAPITCYKSGDDKEELWEHHLKPDNRKQNRWVYESEPTYFDLFQEGHEGYSDMLENATKIEKETLKKILTEPFDSECNITAIGYGVLPVTAEL